MRQCVFLARVRDDLPIVAPRANAQYEIGSRSGHQDRRLRATHLHDEAPPDHEARSRAAREQHGRAPPPPSITTTLLMAARSEACGGTCVTAPRRQMH